MAREISKIFNREMYERTAETLLKEPFPEGKEIVGFVPGNEGMRIVIDRALPDTTKTISAKVKILQVGKLSDYNRGLRTNPDEYQPLSEIKGRYALGDSKAFLLKRFVPIASLSPEELARLEKYYPVGEPLSSVKEPIPTQTQVRKFASPIPLIDAYIHAYKQDFARISRMELYKWEAIKHFRATWDIASSDFAEMLRTSLDPAANLLASGNYLPKAFICELAQTAPEEVREAFRRLYDQEIDLLERVDHFMVTISDVRDRYHPEKGNTFQDHRACMVYLVLRYPQDHFLYKFKMVRRLQQRLDLAPRAKKGQTRNILIADGQFRALRERLIKDDELLHLHHERLTADCYADPTYTVLTQDFVYAIAEHLDEIEVPDSAAVVTLPQNLPEVQPIAVLAARIKAFDPTAKRVQIRHTDWQARNAHLAIIGVAGERLVAELERAVLLAAGKPNLASKVRIVSQEDGDGAGYDVLSFTPEGDRKHIEVKTTTGKASAPFYFTHNELQVSQELDQAYYLYRVSDLNEAKGRSTVQRYRGSLKALCGMPWTWRVG